MKLQVVHTTQNINSHIAGFSDLEIMDELVRRILGYDISDFPIHEQEEILEDCRSLMHDYIRDYVIDKYGSYDLLEDRFQEAFAAFVEYLNE